MILALAPAPCSRFAALLLLLLLALVLTNGCDTAPAVPPTPSPAPPTPTPAVADSQIREELSSTLTQLVTADQFSGVVLVAQGGRPLFEQAAGLADQTTRTPNRLDTKFNLGSLSKMFTAVAVGQLIQAGQVALDDPISKYLPDYPQPAAGQVRLRHLLAHKSGIADYMLAPGFQTAQRSPDTVTGYLPLFADVPLAFPPGARFQYSNSNYIVLGAIIEKVTGQSYFDYARTHIYQPAGMQDTDAYARDQEVPNRAHGYTRESPAGTDGQQAGPRRDNQDQLPARGSPAGGSYSTAPDLLKFAQALRAHTLLNAATTDLLFTGDRGTPRTDGFYYAYGFGNSLLGTHLIIWHNGGYPGVNTQFDMYLDLGYTAIVLSNYDPGTVQPIMEKIRTLLLHD